jgi:hypothetical protein
MHCIAVNPLGMSLAYMKVVWTNGVCEFAATIDFLRPSDLCVAPRDFRRRGGLRVHSDGVLVDRLVVGGRLGKVRLLLLCGKRQR